MGFYNNLGLDEFSLLKVVVFTQICYLIRFINFFLNSQKSEKKENNPKKEKLKQTNEVCVYSEMYYIRYMKLFAATVRCRTDCIG